VIQNPHLQLPGEMRMNSNRPKPYYEVSAVSRVPVELDAIVGLCCRKVPVILRFSRLFFHPLYTADRTAMRVGVGEIERIGQSGRCGQRG